MKLKFLHLALATALAIGSASPALAQKKGCLLYTSDAADE